ncbi:hypothetical protein [Brachyspira hyodysenteriae]|uniref:hypothetical protein n=1 Tax=Brachyspira hyodysenteriae TaxID=159 RepID=UPI00063DD114|nr:hypothetical protein [Brachyspira hyodysenteriae]KLI54237.1 hypothetical protein SZ43_04335 [Brachyspira hyodysenteriae]KLI57498.1 hypothetical protein SZ44_12510 [Brachyspira hyodysenteriae]HJH55068.1 hypothetical protein [Brachyspira hyodysenteriae]
MIKYKTVTYKLTVDINDDNTKRCGDSCDGENSNYCEIYMKKLKKDGDTRYYLRCEECIKELGE